MMNTEKIQTVGNENISRAKIRKIDFLQEQNLIKFVSVPSLESMAIIKVATQLCKQPDIRDAILQHSLKFDPLNGNWSRGSSYNESFASVESNILNNLSLVFLPNLLKAKVSNVIRPIEYQIYEWIRSRKDIDYMESIHWSNEGTIDVLRSFDQLMNKDSANCSTDKFEMACRYCLEDYIPALFNQLPEKVQNEYFCSQLLYKTYKNHLIAYWTSTLKNDLNRLLSKIIPYDPDTIYQLRNSVCQNMFALAISTGNILAVKYFWTKLTASEISNNHVQWLNKSFQRWQCSSEKYQNSNNYSNVTYFLLSQMNDAEQQREVLQLNIDALVNSLFLDWPWQRFLLPTMHSIWSFVGEKTYLDLWSTISQEIKSCKTTEDLLKELWLDTPINLKKCVIQYISASPFHTEVLCKLLSIKDLHTVKLILSYANIEEKRMIMFSLIRNYNVREIIFKNKLVFLNILIDETLLTESDICNLKDRIVLEHGKSLCHNWILEDDWQTVELFFNWAFYSNKQKNEFKNERLDKFRILYSILECRGDYKLADKFVNWCISNDQEKKKFKKDFAKSKCEIVTIGEENWDLFEKFISWCFHSDKDIDEFKSQVIRNLVLSNIIFDSIMYGYNFEFVDKLIAWCYHSNEEVKLYKKMFVLSQNWMEILQRFVKNSKVDDSDYSNWELIQKLIKLFSPLEQEVVNNLKEKIKMYIDFKDFRSDFRNISFPIRQKDLFRLIDKNNFNIDDDRCSSAHDSESSVEESSNFDADAE